MKNNQNLNKAIIAVIIASVIAFVINIIDISLLAGDFTQLASKVQLFAGFIPDQTIQNGKAIIEIINDTTLVIKTVLAIVATVSFVVTLISLSVLNLFVKKVGQQATIFNSTVMTVIAGFIAYNEITSFPSLSGFTGFINGIVVAAIIAVAVISLVVGVKNVIEAFKESDQDFVLAGYEFAKVVCFIIAFYIGSIILTKVSLYISATVLVTEIDLAAAIDIMNYIDVDWNTILPAVVQNLGVISDNQIDLVINKLFDQYVLSFASTTVQNIVLSIARSLIFANIGLYLLGLATSIATIFAQKIGTVYNDYIILGLILITAVIGLFYLSGFIFTLLSLALIGCSIFVVIGIIKKLSTTTQTSN